MGAEGIQGLQVALDWLLRGQLTCHMSLCHLASLDTGGLRQTQHSVPGPSATPSGAVRPISLPLPRPEPFKQISNAIIDL